MSQILRTARCGKCGKEFVPAPYHVFKTHRRYYCTWSCYNHRKDKTKEDKTHESNQNRLAERA